MGKPETAKEAAEITVGAQVHHNAGDGLTLRKFCGPATVLAVDGEQPAAWIRYRSEDDHFRYRSVDVADLEIANG